MVITIAGDNALVKKHELSKLVNDFIKTNGDQSVHRYDGSEVSFQEIYDATSSVSLFAQATLVVVKNPNENKELEEKIEPLVESISEETTLVLFFTNVDKRSKLYKYLKKATVFQEHNELKEHELIGWLQEVVNARKGQADRSSLGYLVDRVGADQFLLRNEIDKLLSYDKTVTRESIDKMVEKQPRDTIFELLDLALQQRTEQALEKYRSLRANRVEPHYVLSMLVWQMNNLALVKTAQGQSTDEIAKSTGVSPFVLKKAAQMSSGISLAQLKKLYSVVEEADYKLKSAAYDADQVVEQLITKF